MHTLLLRLEGPLQSWGTASRFSERDTALEPSKSGVVGLLCAALGKPRLEDAASLGRWPAVATLASLRMGVRCDRSGTVGVDFQTAGGGQMNGLAYGVAKAEGGLFPSVMSNRYFLQDGSFLVGLSGDDQSLLARLHGALASPVWQLYLGRKGYVSAMPPYLADGLVAEDLLPALTRYPLAERADATIRMVLEEADPVGSEPRMDQPVDFERRRFVRRYVRVSILAGSGAGQGGDGRVPESAAP